MIDYLRNLFVSWFNKLINWFSNRHKKKDLPNNNVLVPVDKNKHADEERQKNISEGFQALDEGCKSIANLRAEIEMSQTESKTFKDNEPKVNNDLDAPVPANNNIKNNLEEDKMGNFPIKGIKKFFCGTEKSESAVQTDQPAPEPQVLPSNISPISMRSNNDNSNWMDPNDLNNTFEYQDEKVQKAMKGENNKMGELINEKAEKIKQDVKKEMDDRFAESTNKINQIQEQVNKHEEDMKETNKKVDKIQEEQIDIKKMLAKHDEMIADNKIRIANQEKMLEDMKEERKDTKRMLEDMKQQTERMDEKWREHDAKWMEMFGLYLKKKPRSSRNGNRESTNTSFSSFRGYGYMNMNNSQIPKMERADMAHSYDDNE